MKVMLHGAISMSNYGDYLFAELFTNALRKNGIEVEFYSHPKYGISDYFAKYLNYQINRAHYRSALNECDALVFISGGYFVEPLRKTMMSEIHHIERYIKPAKQFMKMGKPIYILGVGAGPFTNAGFSREAKKILEYATTVTVRNYESYKYCVDYGIEREIIVTADTALLIKEYLQSEKNDVPLFNINSDRKMLLFHIDSNNEVKVKLRDVIIPAIKQFLANNTDYELFLAADGIKTNKFYEEYAELFSGFTPHLLVYDDPWKFTRQIQKADLIVTTKLHVGIVGSSLGKSVMSFPFVSNKTKRFYKQIGEDERCVPLVDVTIETAVSMLEKYKGISICIDENLIEKARMNLSLLPRNDSMMENNL